MESLKKTLYLNVVDSHREIFHGEVSEVTLSGSMGTFTVLPGHVQLISTLKPGEVHYGVIGNSSNSNDDNFESIFVSGGIVEVQPSLVTILADTVIRSKEIDAKAAEESIQRATQKIKTVEVDSEAHQKLLQEMQMMKALIEMSKITNRHRIRR